MTQVIKSGSSGNTASVDDRNRLSTISVAADIAIDAALQGESYFLTSGVVELTSDNLSHIFYIKNNDSVDWVLRDFNTRVNEQTGATDKAVETQFTINPTGGTLLSGTDSIPANVNFGSSKSLTGDVKKGAEGSTVTGGVAVAPNMYLENQNNLSASASPLIIAPGTGFAFGLKPATGNTSVKVVFNATLYRNVDV